MWAFTNANANNNTDDSTFSGNWYNGGATQVATGSPHNNVLSNNVQVSGTNWPSGAQQVISQAGIQSSGGGFPSGYHRLVIANDSLCLDVFGNITTAGAAIDQWTCNGQSNQQFQFVAGSGGYGALQAQNSGDDVTVTGSATAAGHAGHRPGAGQFLGQQPVAAGAAVRRLVGVQELRQRPVPGRDQAPAAPSASNSTSGRARTPPAPTRTSPRAETTAS